MRASNPKRKTGPRGRVAPAMIFAIATSFSLGLTSEVRVKIGASVLAQTERRATASVVVAARLTAMTWLANVPPSTVGYV